MIPNALANTGPYAGLWGHLKSIDHALERALESTDSSDLTELDRDRLQALIDLLRSGTSAKGIDPESSDLAEYVRAERAEPNYSAAIDLRDRVGSVPEFIDWRRSAKEGCDAKIERLIAALEHYLREEHSGLFATRIPESEFKVLRAIIRSLLSEAETALY